jgi:hypothetical protein
MIMRPITPLRPACGERTEVRGVLHPLFTRCIDDHNLSLWIAFDLISITGSETLTLILSLWPKWRGEFEYGEDEVIQLCGSHPTRERLPTEHARSPQTFRIL